MFCNNRYFSELYGKSVVTISKWISELTANGYLSTTYTYKQGTKEIDRRYIRILKGGIKEKDGEGVLKKSLRIIILRLIIILHIVIIRLVLKNQMLMKLLIIV